jgi:hypothetical protein
VSDSPESATLGITIIPVAPDHPSKPRVFPCGQCGKSFGNLGARATHMLTCKATAPSTPAAAAAGAAASASAAGLSEEAAAIFAEAAATAAAANEATAAQDDEEVAPPPGKVPKLRKSDGRPKQTGLVQGATRTPHTVYFKLEVVKTYRRFQWLEKMGAVPNSGPNKWRGAGLETSRAYNGLDPSLVSKWQRMEETLRTALTHGHRVGRKQKHRAGDLATSFRSRGDGCRCIRGDRRHTPPLRSSCTVNTAQSGCAASASSAYGFASA